MDPTDDFDNSNASEKLEAMQSELHCGICHDYFVQAFTLSCSHSFCYDCISAWRANHTDCPVCRRETVGMAPSRALDNMVAALNGGANITNNGQIRTDAWFNTAQNTQQQQNNVHQVEPEVDHSYNGESDDGTIFDSEDEAAEEHDGDYDNSYDDDYYDEEEEGYEDEGEEEQEEGEEEGDYEDDESSYSDSEYDDEDEDDEDYNDHVKRSNQNNPNNDEYWKLRGLSRRPENWRELVRRQ